MQARDLQGGRQGEAEGADPQAKDCQTARSSNTLALWRVDIRAVNADITAVPSMQGAALKSRGKKAKGKDTICHPPSSNIKTDDPQQSKLLDVDHRTDVLLINSNDISL